MLIVLEGVDGSGKTTFANLLSNVIDAEVIHATKDTPNDWEWFTDIMNAARFKNIIADRFFWGQFVYQPKEEWHISLDQLGHLEMKLHNMGGKLIHVTAYPDEIRSRLAARGETLVKPLKELMLGYDTRVAFAHCPVLQYNTSDKSIFRPYSTFHRGNK